MAVMKQYEINREDWGKLVSLIKLLPKDRLDKYYIEFKRKDRSYEQLKKYWGEWLPAILYFLKDEIDIQDTETLHVYLKEYYCYKVNQKYFKKVKLGGEDRYICIFSISFDNLKQEEFNSYMRFIEDNFFELVNSSALDIDALCEEYQKAILIKENRY